MVEVFSSVSTDSVLDLVLPQTGAITCGDFCFTCADCSIAAPYEDSVPIGKVLGWTKTLLIHIAQLQGKTISETAKSP